MTSAESGARLGAAALALACSALRAPGMTTVTASLIRIQRKAKAAMRRAGRHQLAHLLDSLQADLEGTPAKVSPTSKASPWRLKLRWSSLANCGVAGDLAGEQAACQRHADDDGNFLAACFLEEQVGGALAEDVVDDLDADDAGIFDRLQPLLDGLDADAVALDLAGLLQVVQRLRIPPAGRARPVGGQ